MFGTLASEAGHTAPRQEKRQAEAGFSPAQAALDELTCEPGRSKPLSAIGAARTQVLPRPKQVPGVSKTL